MNGARYLVYLITGILAAMVFQSQLAKESGAAPTSMDLVKLGRQVYVSEGCIHCHSQYVRSVGRDQALWGEPTTVERALGQKPVLIGNRRQGPDLANVGQRRPPGWNRLHLIEPAAVVPGSRMPAYRHLFEPDAARGEALLEYLNSLRPRPLHTGKAAVNGQHGEAT